jgi:acetyl esterase/lipase
MAFVGIAAEAKLHFPDVENNVPYSKVAALPFSQADQKLQYADEPLQYALFWRAQQTKNASKQPLVILIHGGCWLSAYDIKHTYSLSTGLSQAGFNVWSIEYRRTGDPGGGWPATFTDIQAGIQALAGFNKGEFDLTDAVLVGHSAGGHLALLAGGKMDNLKGVIGLAAITDIEAYSQGTNSCQKVTNDFMGGSVSDIPKTFALANPAKQPLHAQTYLLQGSQDTIVPQGDLANLDQRTTKVDGAGHFDWIHPGSTAFKTLIQQLKSIP